MKIPIHCDKKMDAVGVVPSMREVDYGNIIHRSYWTDEKIIYQCQECGKTTKRRTVDPLAGFPKHTYEGSGSNGFGKMYVIQDGRHVDLFAYEKILLKKIKARLSDYNARIPWNGGSICIDSGGVIRRKLIEIHPNTYHGTISIILLKPYDWTEEVISIMRDVAKGLGWKVTDIKQEYYHSSKPKVIEDE